MLSCIYISAAVADTRYFHLSMILIKLNYNIKNVDIIVKIPRQAIALYCAIFLKEVSGVEGFQHLIREPLAKAKCWRNYRKIIRISHHVQIITRNVLTTLNNNNKKEALNRGIKRKYSSTNNIRKKSFRRKEIPINIVYPVLGILILSQYLSNIIPKPSLLS